MITIDHRSRELFEAARRFFPAAHMRNANKKTYLDVLRKNPLKVSGNVSFELVNLMRSDRVEIVECFTYRLDTFRSVFALPNARRSLEDDRR